MPQEAQTRSTGEGPTDGDHQDGHALLFRGAVSEAKVLCQLKGEVSKDDDIALLLSGL